MIKSIDEIFKKIKQFYLGFFDNHHPTRYEKKIILQIAINKIERRL